MESTTTQRSFVESLCLAYEVQLVNYLHQMLGNRERARELAQDSFTALYTAYKPDTLRFPRAALFKVATNFALMELRHRRMERRVWGHEVDIAAVAEPDLPENNAVPADRQVLADQVADHLAETIKDLRPALRAVFVMAHVQGKPRKEIAARLGISEKRVDKRMTKALKKCRDHLAAQGIPLTDMLGFLAAFGFMRVLGAAVAQLPSTILH
jgi:RNA polymerase sigma factor (sigma-70 family)